MIRYDDLNPTSCLFIVLGEKLGHFQIVTHVISISYIDGRLV